MKKKKEKGFTLVELLAVVVILAIIVLLAVNAFIPLTQKARKNAFITEIETYVKNAEIYYETEKTKDDFDDCKTGASGNIVCAIDIKDLTGKYVDKSDDNYNGCVYLNMSGSNNIEYKVSMSNGAFKYTGSALNIKEDNVLNDTTQAKCTDFGEFNENSEEYIPVPTKPKDATLLARQSTDSKENYYAYSDKIIEIEFVNHQNHGSETIDCNDNTDLKWCVAQIDSEKNITSDAIIAWLEPSSIDASKYKLYIGNIKKIYAPSDCDYLFKDFTILKTLIFNNFDTSKVTNMALMFQNCSSLTNLVLSNFDTSKVTDMGQMFLGCTKLTSIIFSDKFDTSNVTKMTSMFENCSSLTNLDITNFDTSKVTSMQGMFRECSNLTKLDLSNFNTSNVTTMGAMFYNCSSLINLDLSSFNTSKVYSMGVMFEGCSSLTSLDLSSFNTSNVSGPYGMSSMFKNCSSLTKLDLSSFDTSLVTSMTSMFENCSGLTSITFGDNFNASSVVWMDSMFKNCSSLTSLDLSNFIINRRLSDTTSMFEDCKNLITLDLSNFNTMTIYEADNMFSNCNALEKIYYYNSNSMVFLRYRVPSSVKFEKK